MDAKEAAARRAVEFVRDGMTLGLGTGSTSAYAIKALGERVRKERLDVRGVPTSARSKNLAADLGIELISLNDAGKIDLTIDGADEVDPALHLIKGGGGALLREKLVACASRELIIICDDSKMHATLGTHPLPIAVFPFGWRVTLERLREISATAELRLAGPDSNEPYVTDDGLHVVDIQLGRILDVPALDRRIKAIPGVAETGLFIDLASRVLVGFADGHTEEHIARK